MTNKPRLDVHQAVTDHIIAALESAGEVRLPWNRVGACSVTPKNALTGKFYSGLNILGLWAQSELRGYEAPIYATYKQWAELGAQVRGGEKASLVVFYKEYAAEPDPGQEIETGVRRVAKASYVFNIAQVDGAPSPEPLPALPRLARIEAVERLVAATGAVVRDGGAHAYYSRLTDHIQMPSEGRFDRATRSEDYASVLCHELTHWSGAESRLNRAFGKAFGDDAYAVEECVAELGAAFLCAELGISVAPREDHAQYIAHWLRILKDDKRFIFSAAARASEAVRYLRGLEIVEVADVT